MKTKEKKDHNLEMIKKKNKLLEFIVVKIIYSFSGNEQKIVTF